MVSGEGINSGNGVAMLAQRFSSWKVEELNKTPADDRGFNA
jgi:hypothetical protein